MIMIKIMMPDTAGSKNTRICSTYSNGRIVPDGALNGAGARVVSLTLFRLQSPGSFNDNVTIIVAMQHEMGAGGLRTLHRATLRAIWWTETCGQR